MIKDIGNAKRFYISDFDKTYNQQDYPSLIDDKEFTKFENLVIGQRGKNKAISRRKGFERFNSNTISADKPVYPIVEYISKNKSSNFSRLLIKNDNTTSSKLSHIASPYESGSIVDILTTGLNNGIPRGLIFKDNAYICNLSDGAGGLITNKFYDGTNLLSMGTPPVNIEGVTRTDSNTSDGQLIPTYFYSYIILFLYDGYQKSYCLYKPSVFSFLVPIFIDGFLSAGNNTIMLGNIPIGNNRVRARMILRTIGLAPASTSYSPIYYEIGVIPDNITTEFTDYISDSYLTKGYSLSDLVVPNTPYRSKHQIVHNNILVQGNLIDDLYAPISASDITFTPQVGTGALDPSETYIYRVHKYWIAGYKNSIISKGVDITIPMGGGGKNEVLITLGAGITGNGWYRGLLIYRNKGSESSFFGMPKFVKGIFTVPSTDILFTEYPLVDGDGSQLNMSIGLEPMTEVFKFPSSIAPSEYNEPDRYSRVAVDLTRDDSQEMTGLFSKLGYIDVFKDSCIYKVYTPYPEIETWYPKKVVDKIGAAENSIVQLPTGDYIFMFNRYLDTVKVPLFYHWDGDRIPVLISEKISGIFEGFGLYITDIQGSYDSGKEWVWFTVTITNGSSTTYKGEVLLYDLRYHCWYYFHRNSSDLNLRTPFQTSGAQFLFGSEVGYLYKYGTANRDRLTSSHTTVSIKSILESKTIDLEDEVYEAIMFFVNVVASGAGAANGWILTIYPNETGLTPITSTLASGMNRIRVKPPGGANQVKTLYFYIENSDEVAIDILSMGFDFIPEQLEDAGANN